MDKKYLKYNLGNLILITILVSFFTIIIGLAWTEPTSNPPYGNVAAPLNVGPNAQAKSGGLILNTGGASTGLVVANGNIIFGTDTTTLPAGQLQVNNRYYQRIGDVGGLLTPRCSCDKSSATVDCPESFLTSESLSDPTKRVCYDQYNNNRSVYYEIKNKLTFFIDNSGNVGIGMVPGESNSSVFPQYTLTNLVAGKHVDYYKSPKSGNPDVITDGILAPEGTNWDNTNYAVQLNGTGPNYSLIIYLGAIPNFNIDHIVVQADANDSYGVDYFDNISKGWVHIWEVPPVGGSGLITRYSNRIGPVDASYIRIYPSKGDGAYSVSELKIMVQKLVPSYSELHVAGSIKQFVCDYGQNFIPGINGSGYCIDKNPRGPNIAQLAGNDCISRGGRLCSYGDLTRACLYGTLKTTDIYNPNANNPGIWIGNITHDNYTMCAQGADCLDFDEACSKWSNRLYYCCYGPAGGGY